MGRLIDEYKDIKLQQECVSKTIDTLWKMAQKYQKIKEILNTDVVYRDSDFMKLSAIKRVIDGDKQEDIFWKFIDEPQAESKG